MEHSGPGVKPPSTDPERTTSVADLSDARRAAAGDARAFERLYRDHVARIHGLARRMIGPDQATELTQDVFVRAWQKIGTFRGESAFGTWLHRLAINVMLARRSWLGTQRGRFLDDEDALEQVPTRPAGTELGLDFESAIDRLPGGARQIFVLHDVEGYKHEEIATLLGVTAGTTKAQLHRARMMLRRHLDA
jgi:RNA polymerase sigma-70 factor (ECF subfamily)